eukprot:TRINITY_DN1689_c0_g2_i1.p1 TRINITY_DN1689_c0_g2~~TRINITY_DN1689_c0_g2_i1.p1  ORF type:complete len:303 (+),score=148.66 TRINITY_DN1689_c0_g2_i1:77-910(+)
MRAPLALCSLLGAAAAAQETILVAGASGRSGSLVYNKLKAAGYNVRGLVYNATQARSVLHCTKCDPSEGIYEADVTKPDTPNFQAAFTGIDRAVLTVGSTGKWTGIPYASKYVFTTGTPQEIDWFGTRNQVTALMKNNNASSPRHIIFYSTAFTAKPGSEFDTLGNCTKNGCFALGYKLNAEAYIMQQQVPFSIFKPCGLDDSKAGKKEMIWGHGDTGYNELLNVVISREDVANLVLTAIANPAVGNGVRFDLCSKLGKPQTDLAAFLKSTKYSWQQ